MIRLVRIVRNVEFAQLFDAFFITAITTILVIRFYLKITGYPSIGGSSLHISHLLPGSLMMLGAVLVLLAAVNRGARGFAAVLAGVGFGFTWDELGKFITRDNNYFFHATPGLIYLTFVALYLIVRYSAQRSFTQDDYMANVLDLLKDAAIKDLDVREYEHAKQLLKHVSPEHPMYQSAKDMLETVKPTPARQPSALDKIINEAKMPLIFLSQKKFFPNLVISVAMLYGLTSLGASIYFFSGAALPDSHIASAFLKGDESDIIGGVSAFISAALAAYAGLDYINGRVKQAYRYFEQSLLVTIFIGQAVLFFKSDTIALAWLAVTLLLLINLELLSADHRRRTPTGKA